jgi:hypothetical protein
VPVGAALPVSGSPLALRAPTGADERVVLAGEGGAVRTALELATRLATDPSGRPLDWPALAAVDLAAAAMLIRRSWLGDTIRTDTLCPTPGCGEAIDVRFGVLSYLEHHRPRRYRGCVEAEPGWFALGDSTVRFRIPTIGDLLEADGADAARSLTARCVHPAQPPGGMARRIDRALSALAPRLDGEVGGSCPACGQSVALRFDPLSYVLAELRDAASGLYADVHELARAYHWSEREILELTREHRHAYVAMVREELALA